jgi:dTDP-4-amino-4,6-dideoxygalactose transaminase
MPELIAAARPVISDDDIEAAVRVLRSGRVVQGPEVEAFEDAFCEVSGTEHCVAVNSGTSALHVALLAAGIGAGDEVVVPSFSFAASANAVRLAGAEPVFADIEPASFCLDPDSVRAVIGPRTAAIMPVHLYGHPAAMTPLTRLAEEHGLAIVEDAAQAHAATYDGRPVGSFGAAGCFSFYPTKNMHSLEGGMISTDDAELARTARLMRNQGMEQRYANEIVGANLRMTDVAAAIGRSQLTRLREWTARRQANAGRLDAAITGVVTPPVAPGSEHVYHQYTVRVAHDRDAVRDAMVERGVGCAVYYPTPIHRLKPYLGPDGEPDSRWDLPETERAAAEVLSLPVHPALTDDELDRVASTLDEVVAR